MIVKQGIFIRAHIFVNTANGMEILLEKLLIKIRDFIFIYLFNYLSFLTFKYSK